MKPSARSGVLDLVNAERASLQLPPMTERELSAAVDRIKCIEHRQHWYRFRHLLGEEHATLPGADPVTRPLHVLEVQRAMAFPEVVQLDERLEAHRTGTPLPWQERRRVSERSRQAPAERKQRNGVSDMTRYAIPGFVSDDDASVTFEVEARADTIDSDALLRLGVQHAKERSGLDDPMVWDGARDWALCFARDRLTNYEQLEREINARNEAEQVDPCERCRRLAQLEWETNMDHPHGLDAGCKDCEANMYRANDRAEERRRLLGLAVMAWVRARWPELHVTANDLERWCPVTEEQLASAAGALRRLDGVGVVS